MSNLHDFIQRVLEKRKARGPQLERTQASLVEVEKQMDRLRDLAGEVSGESAFPADFQAVAAAMTTNLSSLRAPMKEIYAKIQNLLARFTKDTINIGVAGKARQGKSTLLQAISGLDATVIPASDCEPVTGAKSRIVHREQDPHAVIEFYQEGEFLREVVQAYYDDLKLPSPPRTISDFRQGLAPLDNPTNDPGRNALYGKLTELHGALPTFARLLSRPSERVGLDKVREYVSQEGGRTQYLAVKCATIHVPFPNGDVTGLGIVDLPGLGEIAKGHGQKLVSSLQQETDVVVLVKCPSPGGDDWFVDDYRVFDVIKQAVPEIELSDWLFIVLNHRDDKKMENGKQVENMKQRLPRIGSIPQILTANCIRAEQVEQQVFQPVLRHLEQNLERIDRQYLGGLSQQMAAIADGLETALEPASQFLKSDATGTGDLLTFQGLFKDFLKDLRRSLEELVDSFRQQDGPDEIVARYRQMFEEACDAADQSPPLPSERELQDRFFDKGGWQGVVQEELHHLRSYLTNCLAQNLDQRLEALLQSVLNELHQRILSGPLSKLVPPPDDKPQSTRRRIDAFRQLLKPDTQQHILGGIDYLLSFTFSYLSHFHYRVREAMDQLDPMGHSNPIGRIVPHDAAARSAEDVLRGLDVVYHEVVFQVRRRLSAKELSGDPMRAVFALVEEVKDQLTRGKDVEVEWQEFLNARRAEIWPDQFRPFAVASACRREWELAIECARGASGQLRAAFPN